MAKSLSVGWAGGRNVAIVWCGVFVGAVAEGATTLTLGPGVTNANQALASNSRQLAIADTVRLVSAASFSPTFAAVNTAQGFTPAHQWVYSMNEADLPAGLINPVAMTNGQGADSVYHLTNYRLSLGSSGSIFGETIAFSLLNPPADPVVTGGGATVTRHWVQVVNTRSRVNGYGFALDGLSGFWQLDNGQVSWYGGAAGPFYDSNAAAGQYSVPYDFYDFPSFYQGVGNYLHFTVFPAWEVKTTTTSYQILGDTGLSWGFSIAAIPEPGGCTVAVGLAGVLLGRVRPRV